MSWVGLLHQLERTLLKIIMCIWAFFWVLLIGSWITNLVKLTDCDFSAPYRCEAIHGVGLFPPAALGLVWFGTDKVTQ